MIIFSYPQFFPGLRDWLTAGSDAQRLVWALLGVLTLPVMFWAGSHYFSGMWQAHKHRQSNMYTLLAMGVSAAWLSSSITAAVPQMFPSQALAQTFYDATAIIIALVNLGLMPELRARGRTSEAMKQLVVLQAKTARVVSDSTGVDIPVSSSTKIDKEVYQNDRLDGER